MGIVRVVEKAARRQTCSSFITWAWDGFRCSCVLCQGHQVHAGACGATRPAATAVRPGLRLPAGCRAKDVHARGKQSSCCLWPSPVSHRSPAEDGERRALSSRGSGSSRPQQALSRLMKVTCDVTVFRCGRHGVSLFVSQCPFFPTV